MEEKFHFFEKCKEKHQAQQPEGEGSVTKGPKAVGCASQWIYTLMLILAPLTTSSSYPQLLFSSKNLNVLNLAYPKKASKVARIYYSSGE